MKSRHSYEANIKLLHDEIPARLNVNTGEIISVPPQEKYSSKGSTMRMNDSMFSKHYSQSWNYLAKRLTPIELRVAVMMEGMIAPITNSLSPLNDDVTVASLSDKFGISTGKVKAVFNKLFDEGVYGRFEVTRLDSGFTKYWVFNPFLSFNGAFIHMKTFSLFKGTAIEKAFNQKKSDATHR